MIKRWTKTKLKPNTLDMKISSIVNTVNKKLYQTKTSCTKSFRYMSA